MSARNLLIRAGLSLVLASPALVAVAGCDEGPAPTASYYEERIAPILQVGCVQQTTGCHLADDAGRAPGNLDLSSYDALMRRQDVLPAYGPYAVGLLLLKAGEPLEIPVETLDPPDPSQPDQRFVSIRTDIRHNAGAGIALDSSGYALLKQWIATGYGRSGRAAETTGGNSGACRNSVGVAPGFDPSVVPADSGSFDRFRTEVQPELRETCAGSSCHGVPIADLYLSCGDTEEELRWNYFVTVQHLSDQVSSSELLRRPLAAVRGGTYHEGGDVYGSTNDRGYGILRAWAEELVNRNPAAVRTEDPSPAFRFFANRVQPVLVRKGCMFLNCHSTPMFHDLRLRGGGQGAFSRVATARNYEMMVRMLAIESPNPNDSRVIAKNLYPATEVDGAQGMAHRGGFLFEDFSSDGRINPASADDCAGVDADGGDLNEIPAYCVLTRWHAMEREAAIARGDVLPDALEAVVWVARPPGGGGIEDFHLFAGGADLRIADATVDPDGAVGLAPSRSLLGECGLGIGPDVRGPAVSWDGSRIAFAARRTEAEVLRLYWVRPDGGGCEAVPGVAASAVVENGIPIHDFDPAFAPDGRLVFASTRGNLERARYRYQGPSRTPADLSPNANLYVHDPGDGSLRQLTFLLNQELSPSFLGDGRVIFTTEKRAPDFHQFAGRRINLDGGDYHPLFAQRDSVGFEAATEVVELPNRNLAMVASSLDAADGAGSIVVVNRSIGPDQSDRDASDRFYLRSAVYVAPGAFGGMRGAYRSPAPLPGGRLLASCDLDATDITTGRYPYALCEIDPNTFAVREIGGEPGLANIETVAVYARPDRGVFASRLDEANGHTQVVPGEDDVVIHVQDFPMLASLLFSNTREGRDVRRDIGGFDVYESLPPPADVTSFDGLAGAVTDAFGPLYVGREHLGWVPLYEDGSVRVRLPGGVPFVLGITDGARSPLAFSDDAPFAGDMLQREEMQFYPGERANQSVQRRFFNGLCGGCHGSISGRELDVVVNVDVLTSASETVAADTDPLELTP